MAAPPCGAARAYAEEVGARGGVRTGGCHGIVRRAAPRRAGCERQPGDAGADDRHRVSFVKLLGAKERLHQVQRPSLLRMEGDAPLETSNHEDTLSLVHPPGPERRALGQGFGTQLQEPSRRKPMPRSVWQ